jgi:hypothetical protein
MHEFERRPRMVNEETRFQAADLFLAGTFIYWKAGKLPRDPRINTHIQGRV